MTLLSPAVPCPETASPSGLRRLSLLLVVLRVFLVSAPANVLYGDPSTVTLRVANPSGQPYGYNLSLRDVLPAGISYVPGSAEVEPRIINNAPGAGQTTL